MKSLEIAIPDKYSSWEPLNDSFISYQLYFELPTAARIRVGKLGTYLFARGSYVYTGSARKNIRGRIIRHLTCHKKKHWHIDYILSRPGIRFIKVLVSNEEECALNGRAPGKAMIPGFGSSDCTCGCSSHLKFISSVTE